MSGTDSSRTPMQKRCRTEIVGTGPAQHVSEAEVDEVEAARQAALAIKDAVDLANAVAVSAEAPAREDAQAATAEAAAEAPAQEDAQASAGQIRTHPKKRRQEGEGVIEAALDHNHQFSFKGEMPGLVRRSCPILFSLSEAHQFPFLQYIFCRDSKLGRMPKLARRICRFVYVNFVKERFMEMRSRRREFAILHGPTLSRAVTLVADPTFKLPEAWMLEIEQKLQRYGLLREEC